MIYVCFFALVVFSVLVVIAMFVFDHRGGDISPRREKKMRKYEVSHMLGGIFTRTVVEADSCANSNGTVEFYLNEERFKTVGFFRKKSVRYLRRERFLMIFNVQKLEALLDAKN